MVIDKQKEKYLVLYKLSQQPYVERAHWTTSKEYKHNQLLQQPKHTFEKDSLPETEPFKLGDPTENRTPISD